MRILSTGVIIAAIFCAKPGLTDTIDTGLYGTPPPADSVFIRWIGDDAPWSEPVWGMSLAERDLPANTYVAISAGFFTNISPGGYYSIIPIESAQVAIISEPPRERTSKVHLILLNADDSDASLVVSGGGPGVMEEVAPKTAAIRAVNPVTTTLQVVASHGSKEFDVTLRRGQNITFVVVGDDTMMIPNTFGPVVVAE